MTNLVSKVALVTGVSSGIGAAISKELVKLGAVVVGVARREDNLTKLQSETQCEKGWLVPYRCDVTKSNDIRDMFDYIRQNHLGVDICVNNAGAILRSSLLDGTPEEWSNLVDLHLISSCLTCQLTIKSLRDRKIDEGHIINISSSASRNCLPRGFAHFYSCTKYALHAATEAFRKELKDIQSKIKVTEIVPGLTNTDIVDKMPIDLKPWERNPSIQPLFPEDIAATVVHILSLPLRSEVQRIIVSPTGDFPS